MKGLELVRVDLLDIFDLDIVIADITCESDFFLGDGVFVYFKL